MTGFSRTIRNTSILKGQRRILCKSNLSKNYIRMCTSLQSQRWSWVLFLYVITLLLMDDYIDCFVLKNKFGRLLGWKCVSFFDSWAYVVSRIW